MIYSTRNCTHWVSKAALFNWNRHLLNNDCGPLLFNNYINELSNHINNQRNVVQYANDTLVYASNIDLGIANKNLEDSLEIIACYFGRNSANLNTSKQTSFVLRKVLSKYYLTNTCSITFWRKVDKLKIQKRIKYKSHYLKNCFFATAIESRNDVIIYNPISNNLKFQTVNKIGSIPLSNFKLLITYVMGTYHGDFRFY